MFCVEISKEKLLNPHESYLKTYCESDVHIKDD